MPPSVDVEIVAVRERLARVEATMEQIQATLKQIQASMACAASPRRPGEVVIPVTLLVAGIELAKALIERFF